MIFIKLLLFKVMLALFRSYMIYPVYNKQNAFFILIGVTTLQFNWNYDSNDSLFLSLSCGVTVIICNMQIYLSCLSQSLISWKKKKKVRKNCCPHSPLHNTAKMFCIVKHGSFFLWFSIKRNNKPSATRPVSCNDWWWLRNKHSWLN